MCSCYVRQQLSFMCSFPNYVTTQKGLYLKRDVLYNVVSGAVGSLAHTYTYTRTHTHTRARALTRTHTHTELRSRPAYIQLIK
jgi:hypothetical protein